VFDAAALLSSLSILVQLIRFRVAKEVQIHQVLTMARYEYRTEVFVICLSREFMVRIH
jgi:hypothetical protein